MFSGGAYKNDFKMFFNYSLNNFHVSTTLTLISLYRKNNFLLLIKPLLYSKYNIITKNKNKMKSGAL